MKRHRTKVLMVLVGFASLSLILVVLFEGVDSDTKTKWAAAAQGGRSILQAWPQRRAQQRPYYEPPPDVKRLSRDKIRQRLDTSWRKEEHDGTAAEDDNRKSNHPFLPLQDLKNKQNIGLKVRRPCLWSLLMFYSLFQDVFEILNRASRKPVRVSFWCLLQGLPC